MKRQPPGPYGIIYADPPWGHRDKAKAGNRGASFKYPTMQTADIAALDVRGLAARDCACIMWAVPPMIGDALYVMHSWGFRFSTFPFVWVKTAPAGISAKARKLLRGSDQLLSLNPKTAGRIVDVLGGAGLLAPGLFWGMGLSTRANVEVCLLGVRGRLGRVSGGVHQVVQAPPGRHSEKPAEVRQRIVQLLGDRPRIELFARERAPGWHAWGNDPALGEPDVDLQPRPVVVVPKSTDLVAPVAELCRG